MLTNPATVAITKMAANAPKPIPVSPGSRAYSTAAISNHSTVDSATWLRASRRDGRSIRQPRTDAGRFPLPAHARYASTPPISDPASAQVSQTGRCSARATRAGSAAMPTEASRAQPSDRVTRLRPMIRVIAKLGTPQAEYTRARNAAPTTAEAPSELPNAVATNEAAAYRR